MRIMLASFAAAGVTDLHFQIQSVALAVQLGSKEVQHKQQGRNSDEEAQGQAATGN